MNWCRSLTGGVLAFIYLIIAGYVAQDEIRHTGGGWINLRGMGTFLVTAPSQATIGNLLSWFGVPKVSYAELGVLGYAQIILHLLVTAVLVYLLGYGLEWVVRRVLAPS
ncbi:MAG: hypothetical protein ABI742_00510 [Gemmatimonadota bacterium]